MIRICLYTIGIIWGIFSLLLLTSPKTGKKFGASLIRTIHYPLWGIIYVLTANIFWLSIKEGVLSPVLFTALAIIFAWKGIFMIFAPKADLEKIVTLWQSFSDRSLRIAAVLSLIIVICFLARIV